MKIAGLDIGTTGCKCTVFDEKGKNIGNAYRTYPVKRSVGGHEIDISGMMEGVFAVIKEMALQFPDIGGIGVTSFGESFVLTDECGNPLHDVMLYTDKRGIEECSELVEHFGEKKIMEITGLRAAQTYSLPKLMWIKKHCPEVFAKASYILEMCDYVIFHLTGRRMVDYSLATRTMAFDLDKLTWSTELLSYAGIPLEMMSTPVPTGTAAGNLTAEAAKATGLSENTKAVVIAHDQVAAATGAGVFDGDYGIDGAGTCQCLTPIFDALPDFEVMYQGYYAVVPYVIPGKYVTYAYTLTGGELIRWCVDTFAKKEKEEAKALGISVNAYLEDLYVKKYGDVPSGLLVLPHFAGAATPYMDSGSKGAILGLTVETEVCQIYRGCMEAVCYEMYLNHSLLDNSGKSYQALVATGGGAKSAVWMQMKADVLGMPITALETTDAGTVGSAMLTGVAIGVFSSLEEAKEKMVLTDKVYEPRRKLHEQYMEIFGRYEKLYQAVRNLV